MTDIIRPEDIMGNIREKVKATILESIPEEKWQQLIAAELSNYFTSYPEDRFGNGERKSEFRRLVNSVCTEVFTNIIKTELAKPEWQVSYDGLIGDKLRETLVKAAPDIITNWFAQLVTVNLHHWIRPV